MWRGKTNMLLYPHICEIHPALLTFCMCSYRFVLTLDHYVTRSRVVAFVRPQCRSICHRDQDFGFTKIYFNRLIVLKKGPWSRLDILARNLINICCAWPYPSVSRLIASLKRSLIAWFSTNDVLILWLHFDSGRKWFYRHYESDYPL